MVCHACGAQVASGLRYCAQCGAEVAPPPWPNTSPSKLVMLSESRVQRNLQTLSYLWLAYGGLRVIHGLIGIFVLRTIFTHGFEFGMWNFGNMGGAASQQWMVHLIPVIATVTLVGAALSLFTGYALLTRQSWGRVLAIVVAILSLIRIPFGTALGIYTLWVLGAGDAGLEYQDMVDRG
ncbi:zinc ribbon domain-containing protein [Edaphobacter sp.]|uniref:zinc ribbon domain-containing protein n=1 Tax=Edaphobacter sp. TaxID=1934404 RepID=UPI002DBFA494|nr:zinc ribbon domain-containing protein [Edaphobacter sp.]HEU5342188.1 zinc ribbon domain-containing protein [Edaphobacter sp.]